MLHPLPKNVYSLRLVSTLVITTHPPRCCEDRARLVADKLANGKSRKMHGGDAPSRSQWSLCDPSKQRLSLTCGYVPRYRHTVDSWLFIKDE
jgi:hypothetical protein